MKKMRVMGVDLSSKTGIAVAEQAAGLPSLLQASEYEFEGETGFARCGLLADQVLQKYRLWSPSLVVIESPITSSKFNNYVQTEIAVAVRFALWQEDVPFINVSPSSLKKFVTGSGNANKNVIMMSIYKQWGFECPTDNIADAVGLALWGLCALGGAATSIKRATVKDTVKKLPPEQVQLIAHALTN